MSDKYQSFAEMLNAWGGGAGTTLFGALIGRAMWHVSEARKVRSKLVDPVRQDHIVRYPFHFSYGHHWPHGERASFN